MSGYIGVQPVPQATQRREYFTATSGQTTFNTNGYTPNYIDVYMNGVKLSPADFTASNGSDVVLASGATTGDLVQVVSFTPFNVANQTFIGDVNLSSGAYKIGGNTAINSSRAGSLTSLALTGNATFGDNDKAIFGAGSDLQIYHNPTGSHSYITESGGGSLYIQGTELNLTNAAGNSTYANFVDGGAAFIRYAGATKLATSSTGISVTGSLNVSGGESIINGYTNSTKGALSVKANASHWNISLEENNGAETWQLGINADGDLSFHNSGSTTPSVMFDDNGRVAIGGTTVTDVNMLNIQGSGATNNIGVAFNDTNTSKIYGIQNGGSELRFHDYSASATRMVIDTNGTIGINATPNANWSSAFVGRIDVGGGGLIAGNAEAVHLGVNWYYDGTNYRYRNTGHASSMYHYQGETVFQRVPSGSAGSTFGWVQSARLDTSGNLLVGTTDSQPPTNNDASGIALRADGKVAASRSNGISGDFNNGSNGDILWFRKAGTVVGNIGVEGGNSLYIHSGDTGLRFSDSANKILPVTTAGSARDNAITLGSSGARFVDLYLSGGVYLGGTGSANKLDDYEEGVFSASMVPSNSGTITLNGGVYKLAYTKIGRKVHIQGLLETTSKSSPVGTLRITNLPFTAVDGTQYTGRAGGAIRASNVGGTSGGAPYSCYILEGGNILYADIDASTVHPGGTPVYSQFYISISYNTA